MPLVDIQLIKGVFTPEQKKRMIENVTDAMIAVEGEAMRPVTWVRVQEIEKRRMGDRRQSADRIRHQENGRFGHVNRAAGSGG